MDVGRAIYQAAKDEYEKEDVSHLKVTIGQKCLLFKIIKTPIYVKIVRDDHAYTIKNTININIVLDKLWKFLLRQNIDTRGCTIVWLKNDVPRLHETTIEQFQKICPQNIIDFATLACDPNITLE